MSNYDLVIIGAGPGGYVSAIRAGQLGLKTAVVEANHLGGICLNWGCIPTKALLRSAEVLRNAKHGKNYGIEFTGINPNFQAIIERSRGVSKQLSGGVAHLLKKNKVEVIDGYARLNGGKAGERKIQCTLKDKTIKDITAKSVIIATGARARTIPGMEADGVQVWDYKTALQPPKLPKSMIILGSGAIGIEFASFYNELGVAVTVVELMPRIVPNEDPEISDILQKSLQKQGMTIKTGTKAEKLTKGAGGIQLEVSKDNAKELLQAEILLCAVGISPNSADIGLESLQIATDRGHIVTNEWAETPQTGVYAIGDVASPPWLAHKAEHEGVIAVERIAGLTGLHPLNKANIAGCTYCHPQIASVGLTEPKALEQYGKDNLKIGKFPFIGNGKAIALGEPEGMIKTIFHAKTGELLGAHLIGAEVTELIQGFMLARTYETTEEELMHAIFPHPTLSEMMHESVLAAFGRAIHI